jgi:hypothetical protein
MTTHQEIHMDDREKMLGLVAQANAVRRPKIKPTVDVQAKTLEGRRAVQEAVSRVIANHRVVLEALKHR